MVLRFLNHFIKRVLSLFVFLNQERCSPANAIDYLECFIFLKPGFPFELKADRTEQLWVSEVFLVLLLSFNLH